MAIEVGKDTYITAADSDTYVQSYFVSGDAKRAAWEALSETDKEVYLRNATARLELLKFSGRKSSVDQTLQFPRTNYISREWVEQDDVPEAIKNAQVEEALEMCCPSKDTKVQDFRRRGVRSASLGRLSESFDHRFATNLNSLKAQDLVLPYLGGGYHVV